jgi:hypothetical protein
MSACEESTKVVEVLNYLPPRRAQRIFYIDAPPSRPHRPRVGRDELK